MEYQYLVIILISLVFSALFSGIEIAFISADKLHIELESKQGGWAAKRLSEFSKQSSRFIGTMLIGNTVALVVYGYFMAKLLEPMIANFLPAMINNSVSILVIQTLLSTLLVLITAEFLPKSLFLINPSRVLKIFSFPVQIIYSLFRPIVWVVIKLTKFTIVKIFGLSYNENQPVFGLTDLNNFMKNVLNEEREKDNVDTSKEIFNNALEFKTVRVRECMVPRTEVIAVEINDDIEELKKSFIDSGHSKILVYKESIDDIIGYCHSLELFKKPKDIDSILSPIIIAPETMMANELLIQLITERKSLALVVDEFGGTSGITSIEDIIEEIFGEIQDEHDSEELIEQKINENTYLLSARHEIDYLNDTYNWEIPEGEYDTLGGFILSINENLPNKNDVVEATSFVFTIIEMDDTRISTVKVDLKREFE